MHILVADDEPLLRGVIARVLRWAGDVVVEVTCGIDLIERLADDGPFDLIVTDVDMGWFDGIQAVAAARAAGVPTPALVVSGALSRDLRAEVARLGGAVFLAKPFDLDELLGAVDALLGDPHATRAPRQAPASGMATVTVVP